MKTRTTFILFLTAIITLAAGSAFGAYSGGTGEPNNPYQIATKADLLALAADVNDYGKSFIMTANIDLRGQVFTGAIIAADTDGNTPFIGTFDGNGHKITHFIINGVGLFGVTSGSIKNLGLENFTVNGSSAGSGLAGENDGSISNCYSTGTVSGIINVGGLVGWNHGSINNSYSTGTISGTYYVGGLEGYNNGTTTNCHSTGTVSGSSGYWIGGLAGISNGWIINCYSTGTVTGTSCYDVGGLVGRSEGDISNCYSNGLVSGGSYNVGGLVGDNESSVSNCYSTGWVNGSSGSNGVGGLVGYNSDGSSVSNCYSTGNVSGSGSYFVGGLVGDNESDIHNCYSTGTVSGASAIGGLVGYNYGSVANSFWDVNTSGQTTSDGGTGETTAEMKTLSTFILAGWDFTSEEANGKNNYWRMCVDGVDYPHLNWQSIAGDFDCPNGVDMEDLDYFTWKWLSRCGLDNNNCGGRDLDFSGVVDFTDFAIFAQHWLEGVTR